MWKCLCCEGTVCKISRGNLVDENGEDTGRVISISPFYYCPDCSQHSESIEDIAYWEEQ